jgi:hypothetical protein
VVQFSPGTLRVRLASGGLLLVLLLQPVVAEQQLRRERLFEPGSEAKGHGRAPVAGAGHATGRVWLHRHAEGHTQRGRAGPASSSTVAGGGYGVAAQHLRE